MRNNRHPVCRIWILCLLIVSSGRLSADDLADKYFDGVNDAALTPQEIAALRVAGQSLGGGNPGPVQGADGSVQLLYGAGRLTVVCAVLQICDVALQPGEMVTGQPQLGDSVRWEVTPSISGSGANETIHLVIKPKDVGLQTTLMVPTDRRTYYLHLKSTREKHMGQVSFAYPEDAVAKWRALEEHRRSQVLPKTQEYLGDLNFNYAIDGSAPWKPERVYNDGRKTIIEMPESIGSTEAPALLVLRQEGPFKKQKVQVNYRLQDNRYIVDAVFDRAILVAGVGMGQQRITITREKVAK